MTDTRRTRLAFRWRWLRSGNVPALIDALRRTTELLDRAEMDSPYAELERDHAVAVARRLCRNHGPSGVTDRVMA